MVRYIREEFGVEVIDSKEEWAGKCWGCLQEREGGVEEVQDLPESAVLRCEVPKVRLEEAQVAPYKVRGPHVVVHMDTSDDFTILTTAYLAHGAFVQYFRVIRPSSIFHNK